MITDIEHIERGYEDPVSLFEGIGVNIEEKQDHVNVTEPVDYVSDRTS